MDSFHVWGNMRRPRHKSSISVDLIGFLDILSTVMVIVLIVISVLSLSLGISSSEEAERVKAISQKEIEEKRKSTQANQATRVELETIGGQRITGSSTFLICRSGQLELHDPSSRTMMKSWDLATTSLYSIVQTIRSRNVYMLVAGNCFSDVEGIVKTIRSAGILVGYEPIADDAKAPWE